MLLASERARCGSCAVCSCSPEDAWSRFAGTVLDPAILRSQARDCLAPPPASLIPPLLPPRRLLDSWVADARRHGVPGSRVVSWVRRKLGGDITVYRCRQDGSLGRATPCLLCSRELARFDLRVHCPLDDGAWFCGRVTDCGAPEAVLTSGQRRMIKGKGCGKR